MISKMYTEKAIQLYNNDDTNDNNRIYFFDVSREIPDWKVLFRYAHRNLQPNWRQTPSLNWLDSSTLENFSR